MQEPLDTAGLDRLLQQGITELQLSLPQAATGQLLQYIGLLVQWNQAYNLTAIRQPQAMLIRHVLDCLAILPHLPAGRLLDVGTGAGLPGLIVAICQPERPCVLLDSNGKKIRFVQHAIRTLQLGQVQAVQQRVEAAQAGRDLGQFEVLTCRAFARLLPIWQDGAEYLTSERGCIMAMKAQVLADELAEVAPYCQSTVIPLQVPELGETRCLVRLQPLAISADADRVQR